MSGRPTVLVVEDDVVMRRLLRTGLELEKLQVLEAGSLAQARAMVGESVDGVVLDRQLPDGDGLDLLPEITERWPRARIVVHSSLSEPAAGMVGLASAAKGDVVGIVDALGLTEHEEAPPSPAARVTWEEAAALKRRWTELCRWDPALPPDAEPALAASMVQSIGAALERPQPLGWGLDPALEPAAEAFAVNAGSVDGALAQLVCLHEAFLSTVIEKVPEPDREEARHRLDMIIHRAMVVAGQVSVRHLVEDALTDPLTGVHNRRSFERDLEREVARAQRHGRPLSVAVFDLDGLKCINDGLGHGAGDEALRAMAGALCSVARREDGVYRIGGDEFALLLVDADMADEAALARRLADAGAPACSLGLARLPAVDGAALLAEADRRLYARRREAQTG
ncbi:MAG TPA: diguanylate cyclase [Acidimicrobiales bacterium]|nr:diguanylate cyclase [Acidimicrobiales bacterium]